MKTSGIEITVVVNGEPVQTKIDVNDPISKIVEEVLEKTGNTGQPAKDWEIRDASGNIVDLDKTAVALDLKPGATLYLSLKAGIGGS